MSEYISIDFSKQGLWLEMAIDDLGNPRHWMTIDGEEIELTKKQYRVLMEQRVEAHKASTEAEQERIIKLLEPEVTRHYELGLDASAAYLEQTIKLIKGEQKVIHTHEIQVFGAPCDCGTRHEYCGECSWVEHCEPEGEQK